MNLRSALSITSCLLLLVTSGCATRYQDLLRDKDMEIRELQAKLADARAENDDLRRQGKPTVVINEASATDDELAVIQTSLYDLDVRRRDGHISIGIDNSVTFASGSIELKKSAHAVLDRVAQELRSGYSGQRIFIEGHTDTDPLKRTKGTYRSNRHLSLERADAVATYLVTQAGLPESQVAVVGYGQYEPIEQGNSASAKAKNRRVEIVIGGDL